MKKQGWKRNGEGQGIKERERHRKVNEGGRQRKRMKRKMGITGRCHRGKKQWEWGRN